MAMRHYFTVGAVAPDLLSLDSLNQRLESSEAAPASSLVVFGRRRDVKTIRMALPDAEIRTVETGLRRMQWYELGSAYLGVTAVSVLMGAVHLPTGIVVQSVVTLAVIIGLFLYMRVPKLARKVRALGLPGELANRWQSAFDDGFALALAVVDEDTLDDVQEAVLEDEELLEPLTVDRRPVL